MQIAFGQFVFDSDRRCLEQRGSEVRLTPKAFHLLQILIERHPKVVSRRELIALLWPDVAVVDANLANLVAEIRRAISDGDGHEWIRTVRRFGYGFAGEITSLRATGAATSVEFQMKRGDGQLPLRAGANPLGRARDSVVPIESGSVSRRHAVIFVQDGKAFLQDLGSRNGTFVRGERVHSTVELHDGDSIVLGSELIGVVEVAAGPGSTESLVPAIGERR